LRNNALPIVFCLFYLYYFALIGVSAVKFMRYMLPIYPFLAITAGYGLYLTKNYNRLLFYILVAAIFIWSGMFISMYSQKHSRVAATEWIHKNIPQGSTIALEHWDDRIPLTNPERYRYLEMTLYDVPDDQIKWSVLDQKLQLADYIILASNRLYVPLQKLTDCSKYKVCYPKTADYYRNLFNGALGFKKVYESHVYPSIDDQSADESFTVYDHPKIIIFKKTVK